MLILIGVQWDAHEMVGRPALPWAVVVWIGFVGSGQVSVGPHVAGQTNYFKVGPRGDGCSLGVVLDRMLCGRGPFEGTGDDLLTSIVEDESPRMLRTES